MLVRTVCKNNRYFCEDHADYVVFDNLVVGEYYDLAHDVVDNSYNILIDGNEQLGSGYVFFGNYPAFEKYDFKIFFYSKEEMRNIKIDNLFS